MSKLTKKLYTVPFNPSQLANIIYALLGMYIAIVLIWVQIKKLVI